MPASTNFKLTILVSLIGINCSIDFICYQNWSMRLVNSDGIHQSHLSIIDELCSRILSLAVFSLFSLSFLVLYSRIEILALPRRIGRDILIIDFL